MNYGGTHRKYILGRSYCKNVCFSVVNVSYKIIGFPFCKGILQFSD